MSKFKNFFLAILAVGLMVMMSGCKGGGNPVGPDIEPPTEDSIILQSITPAPGGPALTNGTWFYFKIEYANSHEEREGGVIHVNLSADGETYLDGDATYPSVPALGQGVVEARLRYSCYENKKCKTSFIIVDMIVPANSTNIVYRKVIEAKYEFVPAPN